MEKTIKSGNLKLLQAFIGIRSPIALLQYCSSFFVTTVSTAQAKYQAYSALLNVLTDYQHPNKEVGTDDDIKKSIDVQINRNEDRLRDKLYLPLSSSNLKSLTSDNCSDVTSFTQETDISSLCTFNSTRITSIYHNYISHQEKDKLKLSLRKVKDYHMKVVSKVEYLDEQKSLLGYNRKREEAYEIVNKYIISLEKIKNNTFLNSWYEELLSVVLNDAKVHKRHVLYSTVISNSSEDELSNIRRKLSTSFNKKVVSRIISRLLDKLKVTCKEDRKLILEYMTSLIDIDAFRGKINYHKMNHEIISKANQLIVKSDLSDEIKRILEYIAEDIQASFIMVVEQEILNEILEKAVSCKSKNKDVALLIVCNGGEVQNKSVDFVLPEKDFAISEIERLYKDMLSIEFIELGDSISQSIIDRLPLLSLKEIQEVFPDSITNKILQDMEESLGKYVGAIRNLKREIVDGVFTKQENQVKKLYELEQELEFSFLQKILHPIYYRRYKNEVKNFVECKSFIHDSVDNQHYSSFRDTLEKYLKNLDKPKCEQLKSLLSSDVDNEFQIIASDLLDYDEKMKNRKMEVSEKAFGEKINSQEPLKEFSFKKKLWHPMLYYSSLKIKSFEMCITSLQKSVAIGDDELFFKAIADIKKNSQYMWVRQLNKGLFKKVKKVEHQSKDRVVSFKELAEGFIKRRKKFIYDQCIADEANKVNVEHMQTNKELFQKDIDNQKEFYAMTVKNESSQARAEKAEAEKEEAEAEKEEERRAKEEAEAGKEGLELLYDEAEDKEISRKRIKNSNIKEFLEQQYTFLILNKGYKTKCNNLCSKYEEFREKVESEEMEEKATVEKLLELTNEFKGLNKDFVERGKKEKESRADLAECKDQGVNMLKCSVVTRVVQAREIAGKERKVLESKKEEVEETVMQKQALPRFEINKVDLSQVAGPSWQRYGSSRI